MSNVNLFVETQTPPLKWEEFVSKYPIGSIALDGFVADGPKEQPIGPYYNANHHENVDRAATLSTAQQVMMNIKLGLDKTFVDANGTFSANVYVNDCDQDVCAAWFLLNNIAQVKSSSNPMLSRFIDVAGKLDVTAGSYPYDRNLPILEELSWVFEPYAAFRTSGGLNQAVDAETKNASYKSIIQDVENRIQKHLLGRGEKLPLDTRYKVIGGGASWKMIEEIGKDGRVGAYSDGADALVMCRQVSNDRWFYTLWRYSEWIPFDIPGLIDVFNNLEGCTTNRWGGGTTVGGCPRNAGSAIPPDLLIQEANKHITLYPFGRP